MTKIMDAIKESERGHIYTLLMSLLTFVFIFGIMIYKSAEYSTIQRIIVIVLFISIEITLLFFIAVRIRRSLHFEHSNVRKSLLTHNLEEEFINTIDSEMLEPSIVEYYNWSYRLRMIITPKWFIYISNYGSVIRKRDDIVKAFIHIRSSGLSDYGPTKQLVFYFSDGTQFKAHCEFANNDIVSIISKAIPDIETGRDP